MKIKVNRKAFSDTLAEVMPFINKKSPIEILKYGKITTKGNRLKIEGNDQQNGIVKYAEVVESDQDGSFLIPMDDFSKFFNKLDGENVEISYNAGQVTVKHVKGEADFPSAPETEYPAFKIKEEESEEINVPCTVLKDFIIKGKNFVAAEQLRPIMTAIFVYVRGNRLGFCASDTHTLATDFISFPTEGQKSFFIMPGVFSALVKTCSQGDLCHIKFNQGQVQYRIGNTIIQTLQVKGNYPNFERVIPKDNNIVCVIEKDDLLKTLQRVCMFASETSMLVKLDITRMDMVVSAEDLDYGKQTSETLMHGGCDAEIKIGMRGDYLQKCIGTFAPGEIRLNLSEPSRPLLMTHDSMPNYQVIQMPMQVI